MKFKQHINVLGIGTEQLILTSKRIGKVVDLNATGIATAMKRQRNKRLSHCKMHFD